MKALALFWIVATAAAALPGRPDPVSSGEASTATLGRSAVVAAPAPAGWIEAYNQGMKLAHARRLPVLIDFRADWCGPCRMMERDTFSDKEVGKLLAAFVCIRVDVDQNRDLAMAWRVAGIPRVVILNTSDQVIADRVGFMPPEEFAPVLKDALAHAGEKLAEAVVAPSISAEAGGPLIRPATELRAMSGDTLTSAVFEAVALPKPEDREKAVAELEQDAGRVRPVLMQLLGDPRLAVRIGALEALEKLGAAKLTYDPWATRAQRAQAWNYLMQNLVAPQAPFTR